MQIIAGTKNAGKIRELKELLAGLPINLLSLNEFENIVEPEETGTTFAENAVIKAVYYSRETGLAALADDSGLRLKPWIMPPAFIPPDTRAKRRLTRKKSRNF